MRRVGVSCLVRPEGRRALEIQGERAGQRQITIGVLGPHRADDGAAIRLACDRETGSELCRSRDDVTFPPGIHDGVAQPQRDVVATDVGSCLGRDQRMRKVDGEGVSPVVERVEDLMVASTEVDRLQHKEWGAELDHPPRIPRCLVEVHDDGIERVPRIDLHVRCASQSFVRATRSPLHAAREGLPLLDDEPHHASLPEPGVGRRHD